MLWPMWAMGGTVADGIGNILQADRLYLVAGNPKLNLFAHRSESFAHKLHSLAPDTGSQSPIVRGRMLRVFRSDARQNDSRLRFSDSIVSYLESLASASHSGTCVAGAGCFYPRCRMWT